MDRETSVSLGRVPHAILDDPVPDMGWQIRSDEFLLRAPGDHYFYYRKGDGITIERGPGADISEEALWLNGSVYAAIACLNGLLPIHASAIASDGRVFAFTGPAGAGKSTLVAALGNRGLPMFSDDTLVLDLSDPDCVVCLPGHKRLKLTADALKLTGAAQEERVSLTVEKSYARPGAGDVRMALPIAQLIFLEEGPDLRIERISGAEKLLRLQDDHYTARYFAGARRFDRRQQFAHLSRLASQIEMHRFIRPLDADRFEEVVDVLVKHIHGASG